MNRVILNDDLAPLPSLLSAYAGSDAARHRLIWALDARFARLVATTSEPMIGQMRIAWWSEALTDGDGIKGQGEPLIDALRAMGATPMPGLDPWLDGWEALVGETDLDAYAQGRGTGLFSALVGREHIPSWLGRAGSAWALWEFSGQSADGELAGRAIALAKDYLIDEKADWPRDWRPLRMAYYMAQHDIRRGRRAPSGLTPGLYWRLLRAGLMRS